MALPLTYNWRNLFVRKLSTALTFCVVAVVVAVLSVLLSFAEGISKSLSATGSPRNLIVLKPGATAESTSIINNEELNRVKQTPGIGKNAKGEELFSPEIATQTSIPRIGPEPSMANVAVRGVDDVAFDVHADVRVVEGARFEKGPLQAIVGRQARDRYMGLKIGDRIPLGKLGNREYTIVGVFDARGGALESEIWAARSSISDSYARSMASSVVLQMADGASVDDALNYVKGPAVRLTAKQETAYYADLAKKTRDIVVLTSILVGIMAIGAAFAVANTMYAAVDARRREIAMLRTIGFTNMSIITAFMIESVFICLSGCLAGLGLGALVSQSWARQDFISDTTWTVLAYDLTLTWNIVAAAVGTAVVVAVIGSLSPALRAAKMRIIDALRKA